LANSIIALIETKVPQNPQKYSFLAQTTVNVEPCPHYWPLFHRIHPVFGELWKIYLRYFLH